MKAGITIRAERGPLSDRQAAGFGAIDQAWQSQHGPARGFSMGRYDRAYVAWQRRYVAYDQGRILAFVTFHSIDGEWVLDLMRHLPDIPGGTMHALVWAAIEDAQALACRRLTLAALPVAEGSAADPVARLIRRNLNRACGAAGLRQFKACFAPHYEPLYMAAPTWAGLILAAWDVTRAITQPAAPPKRAPRIETSKKQKPRRILKEAA